MKHKLTISTLLLLALFLALAPTILAGTTLYVNGVSGNDSNTCKSAETACNTIGHATAHAHSGDSIIVAAATYYENLTIRFSLNVIGSSASTTIIDGGARGTVVTISNANAQVTLLKLTIRNGKVVGYGGGFFPLSLGGGINNSGTLTLSSSTVSGNWAAIPCVFFIRFCMISAGTASGGGIYNSGALIISNSIVSNNHAGSYCNSTRGCAAFGSGISNGGTVMMIKNSTLTGNSAGTACTSPAHCQVGVGGAFHTSGGTVTLNNSTVEGSTAYRCSGVCDGMGGAIVNGSGNLTMNNSTVSGNSAGGIFNGGTAMLQNSIVANNSGRNCSGTMTSKGYNMSSDNSCTFSFSNSGDRNNTNPMLGPLQDNGGPTPTMALPHGSPAIDAGNPSGCTDGSGHLLKTDQRGYPRHDPEDTRGCDMGAYEKQGD